MTFEQVARTFFNVSGPGVEEPPDGGGETISLTITHCGFSAALDSQDGTPKLYCIHCHRMAKKIGNQWVLTDWGIDGATAKDITGPLLTAQETDALGATAALFNQIVKLDEAGSHPYDVGEVVFHIHAIQRIIMARGVRRAMPGTFNAGALARTNIVRHGKDCTKIPHLVRGHYGHGANDDGPYTANGVEYCGRCHNPLEVPK